MKKQLIPILGSLMIFALAAAAKADFVPGVKLVIDRNASIPQCPAGTAQTGPSASSIYFKPCKGMDAPMKKQCTNVQISCVGKDPNNLIPVKKETCGACLGQDSPSGLTSPPLGR